MWLLATFWPVVITGVVAVPVNFETKFVEDLNGNLHSVNPDLFSAVDVDLERLFDAEKDVVFQLFTHAAAENPQILTLNDPESVHQSNFSAANPTRFIIHGWLSSGESEVNSVIRESYLAIGQFNVISVDWSKGAQTINYITARSRVGSVGEILSRMINMLAESSCMSRNSVSLIGHSLGAHIAGVTGRLQNGHLNTIVGLDPAGPLFSLKDTDILQSSNAQYVEAIFTSAGSLGFGKPLGDSNFFANGGRSQPGCGIDLTGTCAHSRSYLLFAESILSDVGFGSTKCTSFDEVWSGSCTSSGAAALMGGEPSNNGRIVDGIYRFDTNTQAPFAQGLEERYHRESME